MSRGAESGAVGLHALCGIWREGVGGRRYCLSEAHLPARREGCGGSEVPSPSSSNLLHTHTHARLKKADETLLFGGCLVSPKVFRFPGLLPRIGRAKMSDLLRRRLLGMPDSSASPINMSLGSPSPRIPEVIEISGRGGNQHKQAVDFGERGARCASDFQANRVQKILCFGELLSSSGGFYLTRTFYDVRVKSCFCSITGNARLRTYAAPPVELARHAPCARLLPQEADARCLLRASASCNSRAPRSLSVPRAVEIERSSSYICVPMYRHGKLAPAPCVSTSASSLAGIIASAPTHRQTETNTSRENITLPSMGRVLLWYPIERWQARAVKPPEKRNCLNI